jgi:hypothetical protein
MKQKKLKPRQKKLKDKKPRQKRQKQEKSKLSESLDKLLCKLVIAVIILLIIFFALLYFKGRHCAEECSLPDAKALPDGHYGWRNVDCNCKLDFHVVNGTIVNGSVWIM